MNLEEEIILFLKENIARGKKLDNKTITELFDKLVRYLRLKKYIKSFQISTKKAEEIAIYNKFQITFFSYAFQKEMENVENAFSLEKNDRIYFLYYVLLLTLRHELEHACQDISYLKNDTSLEGIILRDSMYLEKQGIPNFSPREKQRFLTNCKNFLSQYEDLDPAERLAEAKAADCCLKLFNFDLESDEMKYLRTCINLDKLCSLLNDYQVNLAPTEFYIKNLNPSNHLALITQEGQNLSLNKRIFYGLRISKEERRIEENKKKQLLKKAENL